MAKVLEEFRWRTSRAANYPWDEWFDGQIRQLSAGTDFKVKIESFQQACYYTAKLRGLRIHTENVDGDMVIQAFKDPEPLPTEAAHGLD